MSPRKTAFTREKIIKAALDVVREDKWENVSARRIASRLKSSVAPVYQAFESMRNLEFEILQAARRIMEDHTHVPYTGIPFLNIGVGIVVFARKEPNLFRALFHDRHSYRRSYRQLNESILERMKKDPKLRLLPDPSLQSLLHNLYLYTLGLATTVISGQLEDSSTDNIIRLLKNAGNVMTFAEVSGITDCDSPENEREWTRIITEKNIVFPDAEDERPNPAAASEPIRPRRNKTKTTKENT